MFLNNLNIDTIYRMRYIIFMKDKNSEFELLFLRNQICFPTYAVSNKIIRRYQPLLKELNLTYTQYIVMMVMWEKEIVNEKDLVNALYLKANTLTDLLKKLQKKEYIEIFKDNIDKRNIIIRLTNAGKELKEKAVSVPKTLIDEHWLTDEEYEIFRNILKKLLEGDWGK